MMRVINLILIIPAFLITLFSVEIFNFLIDLGLSWRWSKWLNYIILWSLPIFFIVQIRRAQVKHLSKVFPVSLFVLSTTLAAFQFYMDPLYDGDISSASEELMIEAKSDFSDGLLMISIPGCPYCFAATETLLKLKQRRPNLEIKQVVLTRNDQDLSSYKEIAKDNYDVVKTEDVDFYGQITNSYPTFVLVKDGVLLKKWSNSGFGVVAKDEIEASVN